MANEVLAGIAEDINTITDRIKDARELIGAMKDAGEDTAQLEADLRDLEIRKRKWARMLEARGIKTK